MRQGCRRGEVVIRIVLALACSAGALGISRYRRPQDTSVISYFQCQTTPQTAGGVYSRSQTGSTALAAGR